VTGVAGSDPEALLARVLPPQALGARRLAGLGEGGERPLAAPRSEEEWSEVLRLAGREGWACLVVGRGSKPGWTRPPKRVDLVLSTRGYAGVVAYEPGDGTVTARAGSTMDEVVREVRAGGHHLTPDVPRPAGSTLGGVVAAGQSGFDRLRFGPVRHNVLGMRVALADGSIAKTGGRLVKNVTGYDLHRLYCGSHGTLCVILEASLRLQPAPDARAVCRASFADPTDVLEAAAAVAALPVRPLAVEARRVSDGWRLFVALWGREDVVDWEGARVAEEVAGAEIARGESAGPLLVRARDREGGGAPTLVLGARPSRLASLLDELERTAGGTALDVTCRPAVGEVTVRTEDDEDPRLLLRLHERLGGPGVSIRWRGAPPALAAEIDALTPEPAGLALMRRLKGALDPGGVFAAARLHARL